MNKMFVFVSHSRSCSTFPTQERIDGNSEYVRLFPGRRMGFPRVRAESTREPPGGIAQLVRALVDNREVAGSNPATVARHLLPYNTSKGGERNQRRIRLPDGDDGGRQEARQRQDRQERLSPPEAPRSSQVDGYCHGLAQSPQDRARQRDSHVLRYETSGGITPTDFTISVRSIYS